MKKQLTKLMSLGLALTMALSLTACGGDSKTDESEETSNPVAERVEALTGQDSAQEPAEEAAEGVNLSDWLGGGEAVWYVTEAPVSQLGKDTEVEAILLLEPDGTAYAGDCSKTLGELAQMDEEALIQEAKDAYAQKAKPDILRNFAEQTSAVRMMMINDEVFDFAMPDYIADAGIAEAYLQERGFSEQLNLFMQSYLDIFRSYGGDWDALYDAIQAISMDGSDEFLADLPNSDPENADYIVSTVEAAYDVQEELAAVLTGTPQPGRWALGLNTDQTGNNVESVTLAWQIQRLDGNFTDEITCYASSGEGQTVYDVLYGGVDLDGGALVTRVDGPYSVVLDGAESGLPLDTEAEELFS